MSKRALSPYLEAIRFPVLFTSLADVLAGYLIIAGRGIHWALLLALLLAGVSIYAGGFLLDDITSPLDLKHRLAGKAFRTEIFLSIGLFLLGLFIALLAGYFHAPEGRVFMTALSLLSLFFLYGLITKTAPLIGALNMGACRAFGVLLGMSPAPLVNPDKFLFPLIALVYGYALARFAFSEKETEAPGGKFTFFPGWALTMAGCAYLVLRGVLLPQSWPYLFLFVLISGAGIWKGFFQAGGIRPGVKLLVLSIPALDAAFVAGFRGAETALPVFLLVIPSALSMRFLGKSGR